MTERILTVSHACALAEIVRVAQRKGRVYRVRGESHLLGRALHIGRGHNVQGHPRTDDVRDLALIVELDTSETEAWPVGELIAEHGEAFGTWVRNPTDADRVNLAPLVTALEDIRGGLLSLCRAYADVIPPTEMIRAVLVDDARRLRNIANTLHGKEIR